jgi:hypothetical protein
MINDKRGDNMTRKIFLLPAVLIAIGLASSAFAGNRHDLNISVRGNHVFEYDDNTWFDFDDGSVIITHKERGEPRSEVEITDSYELYIDDERIPLTPEQQDLVREFHTQSLEIVDYAKVIGIEGAKIGLEGAKLGAKAVGCLFKLILPGYDTDDYEAEIEGDAEEIEAKAEILKEKAEVIEEMADELDDLARDMRRDIPEIRELRWF